MGWNSLGLTHDFMRRHVQPGDLCIDATAGRGRDTVLLAKLTGPAGRVIALDIQPAALEATRTLAEQEGVSGQVLDWRCVSWGTRRYTGWPGRGR